VNEKPKETDLSGIKAAIYLKLSSAQMSTKKGKKGKGRQETAEPASYDDLCELADKEARPISP
jgi:hypothetical protein